MTEGDDHLLDPRRARWALLVAAALTAAGLVLLLGAGPAAAQPTPTTGIGGAVGPPPTAPPSAPAMPAPAEPAGRSLPPVLLAGGLVVALAVGIGVGVLVGRSMAAVPAPAAAPAAGPDPHRAALVRALVETRDQVTSAALADHLGRALWEAGVREVRPDGEAFDPRRHQAVDQVATSDRGLDGVVAHTERPGYVDGALTVRPPQVVVHRYQP